MSSLLSNLWHNLVDIVSEVFTVSTAQVAITSACIAVDNAVGGPGSSFRTLIALVMIGTILEVSSDLRRRARGLKRHKSLKRLSPCGVCSRRFMKSIQKMLLYGITVAVVKMQDDAAVYAVNSFWELHAWKIIVWWFCVHEVLRVFKYLELLGVPVPLEVVNRMKSIKDSVLRKKNPIEETSEKESE